MVLEYSFPDIQQVTAFPDEGKTRVEFKITLRLNSSVETTAETLTPYVERTARDKEVFGSILFGKLLTPDGAEWRWDSSRSAEKGRMISRSKDVDLRVAFATPRPSSLGEGTIVCFVFGFHDRKAENTFLSFKYEKGKWNRFNDEDASEVRNMKICEN